MAGKQYFPVQKRIWLTACSLLVLFLSGCSHHSELAEAEAAKKNDYLLRKCQAGDSICGYVDKEGGIVIPYGKYPLCYTDTFRQVAVVYAPGSGCIAIDRSEKKIYDVLPVENGCDYSSSLEGLFRVRQHGKVGFANLDGEIVIPPKYDFAYPFSEGYAAFCQDCRPEKIAGGKHYTVVGGRWGFIDRNGQIIFGDDFEDAASFDKGMAKVRRNGRDYYIDVNGYELRQ